MKCNAPDICSWILHSSKSTVVGQHCSWKNRNQGHSHKQSHSQEHWHWQGTQRRPRTSQLVLRISSFLSQSYPLLQKQDLSEELYRTIPLMQQSSGTISTLNWNLGYDQNSLFTVGQRQVMGTGQGSLSYCMEGGGGEAWERGQKTRRPRMRGFSRHASHDLFLWPPSGIIYVTGCCCGVGHVCSFRTRQLIHTIRHVSSGQPRNLGAWSARGRSTSCNWY